MLSDDQNFDVLIGGRYFDEYEKRNGIWKFSSRAVDADWAYVNDPSKVNLIEYNSTENSLFNSASDNIIDRYIDALEKNKIPVTIRKSRGKDIDAACGQLANKLK